MATLVELMRKHRSAHHVLNMLYSQLAHWFLGEREKERERSYPCQEKALIRVECGSWASRPWPLDASAFEEGDTTRHDSGEESSCQSSWYCELKAGGRGGQGISFQGSGQNRHSSGNITWMLVIWATWKKNTPGRGNRMSINRGQVK